MRWLDTFRLSPAAGPAHRVGRVRLRVEGLEVRATPAVAVADEFHAVVLAGDPKGSPGDSTDRRIDPNTVASPYAGVGSLQIVGKNTSYLGTASVIGDRYIITAAHVVDLNNDGKVDRRDGLQGVYFILNAGGDQTARIAVTDFHLAPDFTGFNRPSVNDDLAVLTLAEEVPDGVPIYRLPTTDLAEGTVLSLVGYGRAGDGVRGYTTGASPFVKRVGENTADAFFVQDDMGRPAANETFRFDFDGSTGTGPLGGPTLGNDRETQLGGGDSGGPAFTGGEGGLVLAGVSSFTQGAAAPKFRSMGGGVNVYPYLSFIQSVLSSASDGPSSEGPSWSGGPTVRPPGAGIGIGANPLRTALKVFPPPPPSKPPDPEPTRLPPAVILPPDPPPIVPPPVEPAPGEPPVDVLPYPDHRYPPSGAGDETGYADPANPTDPLLNGETDLIAMDAPIR